MALAQFIQSPDGDLVVNPVVSVFDQQDSLLTSWLLSTISASFLSSFTDVRTARDVWNVANNFFAADSSTKQSQLRHELHSLRKGSLSIRSYVNKITSLCALLAASGSQIWMAVLLAGLSSEFDAIVSSVSLSIGPLTFQRIVDTLIECEARQVPSAQEVLVATNTVEGPPLQSTDGSFRGGGRSFVRGRGRSFRPRVQCQICSRYGHLAQRCYYRYSRDEQSPVDAPVVQRESFASGFGQDDDRIRENGFGQNYGNSGTRNDGLNPFVKQGNGPRISDDPNPYDSGRDFGDMGFQLYNDSLGNAYGKEGLRSRGPSGSIRSRTLDGQFMHEPSANCVGVGRSWQTVHEAPWRTKPRARVFSVASSPYDSSQFTPMFRCRSGAQPGAQTRGLPITSVRMLPLYMAPLLIQFATDNNVFFEFHPSYCVIKDIQTQEILMRAQVREGLYQFSAGSSVLSPSVNNIVVQRSSTADDIFALWHKRLGHPAPNIVKAVLDNCSIPITKNRLDNICVACQKGKSHKLPFARSNTKYVDLFELAVSDLWGPATVPCEGNLYYVSFIDMTSRFTLGILHRVSCPHTSEQNGVAERKHRHIVETGLTLLAQANLPMKYWGYAFCSAVHLINRLPTPVLDGRSPYQSLFNHEPTYDHLRVFGCYCFPYLRLFVKHELEFRSQPSTFLGYSAHHKGYFCLTPDGKVVVFRHVVFDENRFLFPVSSSASDQTSSGTTTYVPVVRSFSTTETGLSSAPTTGVPLGSHNCDSVLRDSSATCGASCHCSDNLPDVSGTIVREEAISTPVIPSVPVPTTNTHGMITRSKAGIFKPKALCTANVELEPSSVEEALAHPDWRLAVQAEYDALIANSKWELCSLPPGRKAIGCKWLFKIKKNPDGTINRHKARLVAKGCSQVP
ncbi:hypothetical protein CXB51_003624 [Gossypium anomalum]|uniref:Integrase catalytic domain-containing protein n=1 Tax=Gossypium anomalum TaxID=47600 RepID=A0A8J6D9I3_9ROSI|nr:hypothetical protein CXB51_003624 [Gossypium anomalum]